ncbi:hypothetical protein NQ314_002158 [Rhamnusium bicolor]|uniref:Uncharacterized protein n=1 Tax=Rhamnusium bicolor TaxID=1586634 RepID=A0AAV8ZQD1_9CUCU|nr:hypothetical protein NQ314_002158 [Rhamnusium bicolor]
MSQSVPLILEEDIEQGGKEYDEGIENDFAYRNNVSQATKAIRLAFIRKVYGLLTMQLFLTIIIASICMFTPPIKSFVQTKLFAGLCILILGGFMQVFLQSTIFEIAVSFGGALLFSLFIIFDTQLIMKTLSPEEYILATINLYMDIINLFLYILRILQALNRQ